LFTLLRGRKISGEEKIFNKIMKIEYKKLIRDRIPEIILQDGKTAEFRILGEEEYKKELLTKIIEEAKEVYETNGQKEDLIKELADILEIIDYIIKDFNLSAAEIQEVKDDRKKSRGGFDKKIFLEYTEKI